MWIAAILALVGCSEYTVGGVPGTNELGPNGPGAFAGGHDTRDTDGDGITDDLDDDADGDGVENELDPDPDGDGIPGWTLDADPSDDYLIDLETGLPELSEGGLRGRVCAPNGTTWVAGAIVTVVTPLGIYETTSTGDGWWQIDGLPAGDYTVLIRKGHFATAFEVTVEDGTISEEVHDECVAQGEVRIGVVTGEYDAIGAILNTLGVQFDVIDGRNDAPATAFLEDFSAMDEYDLLFFNCGMSFAWLESNPTLVGDNLRRFVEEGGSVYASDWAYLMVETPFPEAIEFVGDDAEPGDAFRGVAEEIDAIVADPAMANLLGGNLAAINYDLNAWVALQSVVDGDVLLDGEVSLVDDNDAIYQAVTPLATRFRAGSGRVTYTTFHNEVQTTTDMERLLEDIVLSL